MQSRNQSHDGCAKEWSRLHEKDFNGEVGSRAHPRIEWIGGARQGCEEGIP